ncbi:MAG: hypothetical protein R6U22_10990, partial [Desulfohalobiaceae bacterium]
IPVVFVSGGPMEAGKVQAPGSDKVIHLKNVYHTNAVAVIPVMESTKLTVGYGHESPDEGDNVNSWYANVKYSLSSNVKIFAEVGDNDKDNTDMGYLAGMQFKF